ncbi:MAG: GNAT family N-acetyltransferase [Bacteroidia bacterium]|nr:GNAT family N-acetyltransferase [Bacteroidia bacterium]NNF82675.1 N-acetyltransferase [Flavobacteriaceae bacterium]
MLRIRPFNSEDFKAVSNIYRQGLDTKKATFETEVPDWESWDKKYIKCCRLIASYNDQIAGFAVISAVSNRSVYKGVAEVSVYVHNDFWNKGIGTKLLDALIIESESNGYWTLQASIFPENSSSIRMHENCGFRIVGIREKIGKLDGKWYNNILMERRSKTVGTI